MAEFLPLDALGSGGKKYGKTGRDSGLLQPLTAAGFGSVHHPGIHAVLPALQVTIAMTWGGIGELKARLPSLQVRANAGGVLKAKLPAMRASIAGTAAEKGWLAVSLPALRARIDVSAGIVGQIRATLPSLRVSMWGAGSLAARLPSIRAELTGVTAEVGSLRAVLPALRMTGNSFLYSEVGSLYARLPALRSVTGGHLRAVLPAITAHLSGIEAPLADGWLMNVRTGGVTRVTCWPFSQFAKANGKIFAIGEGGLYQLGGDYLGDDETHVPWVFETGLSDLGSQAIKHYPYLYVDGIITGEVRITLIDDKDREYGYLYKGDMGAVHMPHKRKLGNGIRSRNIALRIESAKGVSYIEVDALEPEVNQTQRSI